MMNKLRHWEFVFVFFLVQGVSGCSTIDQKALVRTNEGPQKLAIFFDGTNNDEQSDTNIKKLHSLITLQNRNDISALYIEGVGAGGKVLGMGTGWGIQARVKMAYIFLLENYRPNDEIFIFGFSRGAYAGRILASLLYHAGIPNVRSDKSITSAEISDIVYDAVKSNHKNAERRRKDVEQALADEGLSASPPVPISVLGLWDTVEALGLPDWPAIILDKLGFQDYKVDIDNPNKRYGDQLCNVKQAFHAVSIDDDRERVFTPLLLTRDHLFKHCSLALGKPLLRDINEVDEVWFSGAHSDVGGGYQDSLLSGVSLNWMIKKLKENPETDLLPRDAAVPEDLFGSSHDPESGFWSPIYHAQSRDIRKYAETGHYNNQKIKLHRSVIERLNRIKPKSNEYNWVKSNSNEFDRNAYPACFDETSYGLRYNKDKCKEIEIVDD